MKRITGIIAAAVSALAMLAGCAGGAQTAPATRDTPEGAVTVFYRALDTGDWPTACGMLISQPADCATSLQGAATAKYGNLKGIGNVHIDQTATVYNSLRLRATIPQAAQTWDGGATFTTGDVGLSYTNHEWWIG